MRNILAAVTALLASCTTQGTAVREPEASSRYTFWRPAPVENATEPSEVIKNAAAADWRDVDPENLLIMDLRDGGRASRIRAPAPRHAPPSQTSTTPSWLRPSTCVSSFHPQKAQ